MSKELERVIEQTMADVDRAKQEAETALIIDIQRIIGADNPYHAVELSRYIEHRESQLRESNTRNEKVIAAAEACVGHYADKSNWQKMGGELSTLEREWSSYMGNGYDYAVTTQKEIARIGIYILDSLK